MKLRITLRSSVILLVYVAIATIFMQYVDCARSRQSNNRGAKNDMTITDDDSVNYSNDKYNNDNDNEIQMKTTYNTTKTGKVSICDELMDIMCYFACYHVLHSTRIHITQRSSRYCTAVLY